QMAAWQAELSPLEERLADPATYASSDRAALEQLQKRQAELAAAIAAAESRWLEVQEQLDALPEPA
ncbi:MAG TPA: ABC transporter ATP-binding protein, partial [Rhodocyclaceae bacterium]